MKTPDTTEAMPSAQDSADFTKWCNLRAQLLRLLGAPGLDIPWGPEWVAWLFDCKLPEAQELQYSVVGILNKVDPHERWHPFTLDELMGEPCVLLGLPSRADIHQQPTDLRLAFPAPLNGASLNEYMTDPFDVERPLEWLTPELLLMWRQRLIDLANMQISEGLDAEERMRFAATFLKEVGLRLLAFTCPEVIGCRAKTLMDQCNWLKYTRGCFNLQSGALTDEGREVAAMREFDMNGGAA